GVAVAAETQALDQRIAVHPLDRRLAGGVDLGRDHRVGIVEAGAELVEEVMEAGEAMRLDDRDHLARGDRPPRLQYRRDLDGVVAVIVEDVDAVPRAGVGEASLDAAEAAEP